MGSKDSKNFEQIVARVFGLNDENWMRHANPWSVYSRYSVLPILVLSIWSRQWIGWFSLIPVLISLAWMFLNPILFPKPSTTKNWASRAVLGERIYLRRDQFPLPEGFGPILQVTKFIAGMGFLLVAYSLWEFWLEGAVFGTILTIIGKSWFLDRMVWLFESCKDQDPEFVSWDY